MTDDENTRLHTAQRDYVDARFGAMDERFRGIDRATKVLNETVTRTPTDIQKAVANLQESMTSTGTASVVGASEQRSLRRKSGMGVFRD